MANRRRLYLSGADICLYGLNRSMEQAGCGSNLVQVVLELEGRIPKELFAENLERFLDHCPWPAARLKRSFPWSSLRWEVGERSTLESPPVLSTALTDPSTIGVHLDRERNRTVDPRREPPVRFHLFHSDHGTEARTWLAVTWLHPLMDPRGAENLTFHLDRLYREGDGAQPDPSFAPEKRPAFDWKRFRSAGKGKHYLDGLRKQPLNSPGTVSGQLGSVRHLHGAFRADPGHKASRIEREMTWRLALVGKALSPLWQRRGLEERPFLLPISVDRRKKGERGPIFTNHLTLHFPSFRAGDDIEKVANDLRMQMLNALRHKTLDSTHDAMEFLRFLPISMVRRKIGFSGESEVCSFNFADTGPFRGAQPSFLGCRVLNAYHAPSVPPKPGIGVFLNQFEDKENIVVSWIDGIVKEEEAREVMDRIHKGLGWLPVSTPTAVAQDL